MRSDLLSRFAALLLVAPRSSPAARRFRPGRRAIGVPNRVNEYPSVASQGAWVAIAWAASSESAGTDVYAAVSRDGGASFGSPVRVNAVEKQASINGEQPPRIAFVAGTSGPLDRGGLDRESRQRDGALSARSNDGGRSFGASQPVPGSDAAGNRGWESIAVDSATGRVYAVWLDHRDTAAEAGAAHAAHQHGAAAPSGVSSGEVGSARSGRSCSWVRSAPSCRRAASRAASCYCCKTAAITAPDGALYLAWRHVYAGNQRDIAVSTSRDRGRSFSDPVRVSEDRWQLEGCPENGPSLAVGNQGRVFVLWPTLVKERGGETLRLFLSSTADGRRFAARAPLPTAGAAYHPQLIASPDGTLVAAWDEVVNGAPRRVRLARGRTDDHGQTQFEAIDLASDAEGPIRRWPSPRTTS
jgi:hypothetical protein